MIPITSGLREHLLTWGVALLTIFLIWCSPKPVWAQCNAQKFTDSIGECGQFTGYSMDMCGRTLVVGAFGLGWPPLHTGAAFILERSGSLWTETQILLASDGVGSDLFGNSVAISGDTIVIGAQNSSPLGQGAAGSAYVFQRVNGVWLETQRLLAADLSAGSRFGFSVDIDGGIIAIGAPANSAVAQQSGAVYVFERQGALWTQTGKRVGNDTGLFHQLGRHVAVSGNRIAAASLFATTTAPQGGAVYVFEKAGTSWPQRAKVFPPDAVQDHRFGSSLALEGPRLFVGASRDSEAGHLAGAVYAYELEGTVWQLKQKILPMALEAPTSFAEWGLAVSGKTLVVGDTVADGNNLRSGAMTIYRESSAGWHGILRFFDPAGEVHAHLGRSVAVWGDHIAGGAPDSGNGNLDPSCQIGNVWLLELPTFARPYCFGVACPCGNDDPHGGCARSGGRGARLEACGSGSVAADDASFRVENLPAGQPALLVRSLAPIQGGVGTPFGDGLRCANGQESRLEVRFADSGGNACWGPGYAHRGLWQAGDTASLQVFYRDSASPCGTGFNATNAVETTFEP